MPDAPIPAPVKSNSRRALLLGSVALLAVLAVGWFAGDVPHRYAANQAMREGRVALLASDLPKALGHFRVAALQRPTDEAVVQQYDQTQSRWVEMVGQKIAKLDAAAAYAVLRQLPPTESLLVEPHLSQFRERAATVEQAARTLAEDQLAEAQQQADSGEYEAALATVKGVEPLAALVPDFVARRQAIEAAWVTRAMQLAQDALAAEKFDDARDALKPVAALGAGRAEYAALGHSVDEAEVRALLHQAGEAAEKHEFKAGAEALARAATFKLLAPEVQAAQENLQARARDLVASDLAGALAKDDATAVAAALEEGHEFAGWGRIDAASLLQPTDLPSFLKALDAVGLGAAAQAKFTNRIDIPLVLYRAAKFPAEQVKAFAREQLVAWSRHLQEQKLLGLALCLDDEARQYGAPTDAAWRSAAIAQAAEAAHAAIAVAPPKPDSSAPAGLADAATAALRKALQAKVTWPKFVDYDPAKPVTVVLRGSFGGFYDEDDDTSDTTIKKVRYQSGTQQVPNEERRELVAEHNELLERYNQVASDTRQKQDFVDQVNANYNASAFDRSQATDRSIEIASNRYLLGQWDRQLRDLRARGDAMPKTVSEPVYADESYEVINHVITCRLYWRLSADLHGEELDVHSWMAETPFRTQEVSGDPSHGVPVRAPDPVPKAKLMPGLVRDLVGEVAKVDEVVALLPEMTLQSFSNFYTANKTSPLGQAEGLMTLVYGWEHAGREVSFRPAVVRYAREALNLPAPAK